MLKRFIPHTHHLNSREEISQFFKAGDFHNAFCQLKTTSYQINEFMGDIQVGAGKMLICHRASELLGYIHKYKFRTQYDVKTLLLGAFDAGDYHGFLKNVFRFKFYRGLDKEVENSINYLLGKGQVADAQGWRQKIDMLKEREKYSSSTL
ncbi:MAG: hypothetical protein VB099_11070 [Candidatus Limiplasma sp.]|nr:hypothetical protein [Candidatus Limiplasma sp.]